MEPAPSVSAPPEKSETHDVASVSPLTSTTTVDQHQTKEKLPAAPPIQHDAGVPIQPPALGTSAKAPDSADESAAATARPVPLSDSTQATDSTAPKLRVGDRDELAETTVSLDDPAPFAPSTAPPLEIAEASHAHKGPQKHTPPILAPPYPLEQPSPSSSIDPYSNNTPAPATASPDTSPADEVTDAVDKIDRTSKDAKAAQRPSSVVPSTPDEQLRLEEAQSLHHNTLQAGKSIGDKASGKSPLANEVIQENVGPTATVDKDQAPSIPVPHELKQPDEIVNMERETHLEQGRPSAEAEAKVSPTVPTTLKKPELAPPTLPGPTQPERMTTRVSSGAIRHKSVSEILGEAPKPAAAHADQPSEPMDLDQTPESAAKMRLKDRKEREKERSRMSTVVFPKQLQLQQQDKADSMDLARQGAGDLARVNEERDYLFTLFQSKAYSPPRGTSLSSLLGSAHKTLSTANHLVDYSEQMDCRMLRRIYALQHANRWPLRQLKRSVEPPRQGTHWDVLLDHLKWMRTDFREERKWKVAAAKCCAEWCAEYVNSDPEHRSLLRVPVKIPPKTDQRDQQRNIASPPETRDAGNETIDPSHPTSHPTPDLVPSAEDESVSDSFNDEAQHDVRDTIAPAAIFSLGSDEFTFSLAMTPTAAKLLDELPLYAPAKIAPDTNALTLNTPPDSTWKTDLLPVSKYSTGKITLGDGEPPKKRSRYDYSQYENNLDNQVADLPPEQIDVALFRPENRHIRDRIHPGHSFRPPTEHIMPSVGFFENRQSSQWTYSEDDELRQLVKEYSYNWSLISSCLSPPSLFSSGAERRTPWECFERWISLEGLPADLSKTPYFRAYHQRLETAQRTVLAQQQAAQQQQQQQGNGQQLPIRRRTTQPLRVDRRRSSKHFALLDAMRKLAKKRETMLQKQQQGTYSIDDIYGNEADSQSTQLPIWRP